MYAHPDDFEMTKHFSSKESRKSTIQNFIKENPNLESLFIMDVNNFVLPTLKPIKSGFIFDLGNRKLEVIEVSGHTKGSIVLLDSENKLLFTGDNNNALVWLFLDGCLPIESYLKIL